MYSIMGKGRFFNYISALEKKVNTKKTTTQKRYPSALFVKIIYRTPFITWLGQSKTMLSYVYKKHWLLIGPFYWKAQR